MNKLPLSISAISVAVAVVLWYIATVLEGRLSPPEPEGSAGVPEFGRQVEESGLRGGAAAIRCLEAEQRIQERVDAARYCERDEDCTIFDFGYPIQCLTSVARSEITGLRHAYRDYEESCEFRVYYDCPSEPLEREPVCRNNRCEVELRTLDELRDQTLDYLGVEQ